MNSFTRFFHDLPSKQDADISSNLKTIYSHYLYGKRPDRTEPSEANAFSFKTLLCLFCYKDQPSEAIQPNDNTHQRNLSLTKDVPLITFIV